MPAANPNTAATVTLNATLTCRLRGFMWPGDGDGYGDGSALVDEAGKVLVASPTQMFNALTNAATNVDQLLTNLASAQKIPV